MGFIEVKCGTKRGCDLSMMSETAGRCGNVSELGGKICARVHLCRSPDLRGKLGGHLGRRHRWGERLSSTPESSKIKSLGLSPTKSPKIISSLPQQLIYITKYVHPDGKIYIYTTMYTPISKKSFLRIQIYL